MPVSAGFLRSPERYFAALTAYRAGDVDPLVVEMSNAALAAVANGRRLSAEIGSTRVTWLTQIKARSDSSARRRADVLFTQPVINAERAAGELGISDRVARAAIDEFARRAGRRTAGH